MLISPLFQRFKGKSGCIVSLKGLKTQPARATPQSLIRNIGLQFDASVVHHGGLVLNLLDWIVRLDDTVGHPFGPR